jgi:tRNA(Ile)-lysidine synthase
MNAVLERVRRYIARHDLARRETRVVAAVSGGSDSAALAYLLHALDAAGALRLSGIAHFNHQLRSAADDDERLVEGIAASLRRPLIAEREEVSQRARRDRRSTETAAREARYEFFERARVRLAADVVALGHTRDDQAETVLLRLTRGAGLRGLAGMHPRNGTIIRPLLDCRRAELRDCLVALGVAFATDETNADVNVPRNRVRHELLPLLARRFNPRIVDVLAREAELAREEWRWRHQQADELFERACRIERAKGAWALDVALLNRVPLALRRAVVCRAMHEAAGERSVGFEHVQAVLGLMDEGARGAIDIPGQRAERVGSLVVLAGRPPGSVGRPKAPEPVNIFRYPLSIPGEVSLPESGCLLTAELLVPEGLSGEFGRGGRADAVVVRRDACREPLAVRNRRPGDRFRPAWLRGRKKLQDYFVDLKVPRPLRDRVPLVVDGDDRIVWVAGHAVGDEFRVTAASQAVITLKIKALGGIA